MLAASTVRLARTAVLAGELAGVVTVTALPMTKTRQNTQNTAAEWLCATAGLLSSRRGHRQPGKSSGALVLAMRRHRSPLLQCAEVSPSYAYVIPVGVGSSVLGVGTLAELRADV